MEHPLKDHPESGFRRPPQSRHYQYIKRLHDRFARLLRQQGRPFEHEEALPSAAAGYGYLFWEKATTKQAEWTFHYWSNTSPTGVRARATGAQVQALLQREREAAAKAPQDWPFSPECGSP